MNLIQMTILDILIVNNKDFPVTQVVKKLPVMQENRVQSLSQEDPLEKGMAIHSSIFAWRIPWTGKPGGLQFVGSQSRTRLGDCLTHKHAHTHTLLISMTVALK